MTQHSGANEVSAWDDFPVHQVAEPVRFVGTSDRNFYDRYYFNAFPLAGGAILVIGLGQYPNLGVTDAFAAMTHGDLHRVVRASRPLTDRSDLSVGPFRVEVLDPLRSLRVVLEPNNFGLAFDLTWSAAGRAWLEPRHFLRSAGRVVFDTQRLAQTGGWRGVIELATSGAAGSETIQVSSDSWWGTRDRSWGVRPIGAAEPPGIHVDHPVMAGMWHYNPVRFDNFDVIHICQETDDGRRTLEEAVLLPHDAAADALDLGSATSQFVFRPGTRIATSTTVSFSDPDPAVGESMSAQHLATSFIGVGTGYGLEQDWRHGMYQGPSLVVQGIDHSVAEIAGMGQYVVVDHAARWRAGSGAVGYGLHEHGFFGPYRAAGLANGIDGATAQ